jgi:WD40 repeat protein
VPPLEYKFYTEFQSHDPEFDCLKSVEIEPKINVIEWWRHTASNMMLLTSNDKTIKLWRLGNKPPMKKSMDSFVKGTVDEIALQQSGGVDFDDDQASVGATRKQCFKNAHGYNIHSVSVNSDGASFFSADDLRINLWHVEREDECYTIVDLKPPELTEVDELITVARFHPRDCATLMHGSSKGVIRLADLRQRALVDRSSSHMFAVTSKTIKNYFSEITDSILDAKFSEDGRYILSRDYMTLRLWDTRNSVAPIHQAQVHPYLHTQFIHLLDNEAIFDQFQCAMSRDGLSVHNDTIQRTEMQPCECCPHTRATPQTVSDALLIPLVLLTCRWCACSLFSHFVSGTYSNSFTLHNVLSHRTVTIKARDDAREPLLINQHYNYDNGAVGYDRPTPAGNQPWRSNVASDPKHTDFAPQTLSNINIIGATGDNVQRINLSAGGTEPPPIDAPNPAQHFNQLKPTKPPNYRKKVLKVAWHPRMNAVAVAGLYKLYLYQQKAPLDR